MKSIIERIQAEFGKPTPVTRALKLFRAVDSPNELNKMGLNSFFVFAYFKYQSCPSSTQFQLLALGLTTGDI